jgi:hypothetical protein
MKFLGISFLLLLISIPPTVALAGPPSTFYFSIQEKSVRLQLTNAQEDEEEISVLNALQILERRVLPDILDFFDGSDTLKNFKYLYIVLEDSLPNNYCAIVPPQSTNQINVSRTCMSPHHLALLVTHEFWHLLTNRIAPNTPNWLNEGLADVFVSRITRTNPIEVWRQIMNGGISPSLVFDTEDPHAWLPNYRTQRYGFNQLFLTYLYDHFGRDEWLKAMLRHQNQGKSGIQQALTELNGKEFEADPKFFRFNSLFLNFSMALNINSTLHASNLMFSLGSSESFGEATNFRMFPQFDLVTPSEPKAITLKPYQTSSLLLTSSESCLKWQSSGGRTQIYKIKDRAIPWAVEPNTCFTLMAGEFLTVIQYEDESTLTIRQSNQ